MNKALSLRRLVENEVYFRQRNEHVVDGFKKLAEVAKEEGQDGYLPDMQIPIHFYCECADEKCRKRVKMTPKKYAQLHKNRSQFVILPTHNVPEVERIRQTEKNYLLVEKYDTPPKKVNTTKSTDLNNV